MKKNTKVLLTGGTGQLGKMLIREADIQHLSIDILTREKKSGSKTNITYVKADLTDYTSLNGALNTDYDVVVHCASNPKESDLIDVKGTQNLLGAIKGKGVKNFIYTSIVGVDKTTYKYYKNKLRAEELIIGSGVPYTILRITQFHDFVLNRILFDGNENEASIIPAGIKFQSIDLSDVCKKVFQLIESENTNSILQIGGPQILNIQDIIRDYQRIIKPSKKIETTTNLNDFQKLFTSGINLCTNNKWGSTTWRNYLSLKQRENNSNIV